MGGLPLGRIGRAARDLREEVCPAWPGRHGGKRGWQQGRPYDVARDGRFLINTVLDSAPAPITLLQNWNPAVKK